MNKKGFTLIHMAALLMILGVALIVTARHFSSSNVTEHVNRYAREADGADRELKFFIQKYRKLPDHTSTKYDNDSNQSGPGFRYMADNSSTTPELYRAFIPRPHLQMMYISPVLDDNWNGDVCAILPHTAPYTPSITPPNNDYSVKVVYCDGALTPDNTSCVTPRYTVANLIYAIAHPGDDSEFQSAITGNTIYIPSDGNDDLIRYLSARDAYDLGGCSFKVARVPRQDPRYHNSARYNSSKNPPSVRTWVTVEEHLANGSTCLTATGGNADYNAETLSSLPSGSDIYGSFESRAGSPPYSMVRSCGVVHFEFPVNRLGEVFKSEKCCIELQNNRYVTDAYAYGVTGLALPQANITSNCERKFQPNTCGINDGYELNGRTPYVNITNPFITSLLGPILPVPPSGNIDSFAQGYIPARLKITFQNGNRLYRIDDDATMYRVEYW
jgi:hypothetical protein